MSDGSNIGARGGATVISPSPRKSTNKDGEGDGHNTRDELLSSEDEVIISSLSDVTKVIARAPEELRSQGLRRAEDIIKDLPYLEQARSYPEATNILALMNIIISCSEFVKQGGSYLRYMSALVASKDDATPEMAEERTQLLKVVNFVLGRSPDDISNVEPGDIFIREAYNRHYGWMLSGNRNYEATSIDNFCGFDLTFITQTISLETFSEDKISSTLHRGKVWKNKRDDLIVGTAVVVIHVLLRDVLRDNPMLFQLWTEKPVARVVAMCVAGLKVESVLRSCVAAKPYIKYFEEASVDKLPDWNEMRDRVEQMVKSRQDRATDGPDKVSISDKRDTLSVIDALAWIINAKGLASPPAKKRPNTGDGKKDNDKQKKKTRMSEVGDNDDGDNGEEENQGEKEDADTADAPDVDVEDPLRAAPKEDLLTWPGGKIDLHEVDVDSMSFSSQGSDDGANVWLTTYTKTNFMDGTPIPADIAQQLRPRVEYTPVKSMLCDGVIRSPELIIIRNALSQLVVDAILGIYRENGLPFVREDGKAFRAFVCDPAEADGIKASFQMGKNAAARYMRAFDAHDLEKLLAAVMESKLRVALKHKYGDSFKFFINSGES